MDLPEDLSRSGAAAAAKRKVEEDANSGPATKRSSNSSSEGVENNITAVTDEKKSIVQTTFQTLDGFKVDSILSNSADFKRIVVEGTVGDQKAVIILDKKPFTEDILSDLFSKKSELVHTFQNDIYGSYDCVLEPKLSGLI